MNEEIVPTPGKLTDIEDIDNNCPEVKLIITKYEHMCGHWGPYCQLLCILETEKLIDDNRNLIWDKFLERIVIPFYQISTRLAETEKCNLKGQRLTCFSIFLTFKCLHDNFNSRVNINLYF